MPEDETIRNTRNDTGEVSRPSWLLAEIGIDLIPNNVLASRRRDTRPPTPTPIDFRINSDYQESEITEDSTITDRTGKERTRSECVYFDGDYYHHSDKKNVVKDVITEKYIYKGNACEIITNLVLKSDGFKETKGFTHCKNFDRLPKVYSKKYQYERNGIILKGIKGWEFKEDLATGIIVDLDFKVVAIADARHFDTYKNNFSGCADYKKLLEIGVISPSYAITEGLQYTFGIEIECSRGFLPLWVAHDKYNVLCVRDGSINNGEGGPEYVTGILKGDTGFKHLQDICLELSKRTLVNASTGIHVHIGNVNFTKQFLVNSYRLALLLEDEIMLTLPKSRRKNRYCKTLKKFNFRPALNNKIGVDIELEEDYNTLFRYISVEKAQNPSFEYNKNKQHPMGAKCGYNHDTPRYCWLNYVPAMFNTRENGSYSIEFRPHPGSTNFTKIKNWLLFTFAFIAFTEKYPELIEKGITINDVLSKIFPKKASSLIRYFNLRKELFTDVDKEGDEYKQEIDSDKLTIKQLITN